MINFKSVVKKVEYADLHLHTNASDGDFAPGKLVKLCAKFNLKTIAITDHDTVAGVEEAKAAGEKYNVTIIPGIELGTSQNEREIHILGFYLDVDNPTLIEYLAEINTKRLRRTELIVESLARHGIEVNINKIIDQAGDGTIGRPHIAKAMVEAGVVKSYQAAFNQWIGDGAPAYEKKSIQRPEELIEIIHEAGGAAVLAHPGTAWSEFEVRQLKRSGLDGIEVIHPRHTKRTSANWQRIAFESGLLVTGGSDFHSEKRRVNPLGKYIIEQKYVKQLDDYCRKKIDA
ncbi:MAG: PHP domain-containing protein [Deferribacteres bacterium]|nr:PHP domain-containing protein [candidate division KSB1 bacterium]MCB9502671.1 PHP domain-containing protein [Deferribacteres bacterium]